MHAQQRFYSLAPYGVFRARMRWVTLSQFPRPLVPPVAIPIPRPRPIAQ